MVPAPFDSVGEGLRAKMEVASEPKEEAEEEDTEGVDLMRAIMQLEVFSKLDESKIMVHEIEDGEVGVQDNGFPI